MVLPLVRPFIVTASVCLGMWFPGLAQTVVAEPSVADRPDPGSLPPGLEVEVLGRVTQGEGGEVLFDGPVTVHWRESRFQADRLVLTQRRYVEASGNVLIVWGRNRIFGSRMTYDLETERGVIDDAIGYALDDYMFWAHQVEKVGTDKLRLRKATVTTCTQPVPYWSFAVSSATIRIDKYARMRNVRLRARSAPIVYLPYLVWPVKEGRAAGLLMPEFHTTQSRGRVITEQLFIPLGRSADVTLLGRYYTEAGFGGGGELRFVPNAEGSGQLSGFYINDLVDRRGRYRADYKQTQQFLNGFRMVADAQIVSDFDYFVDFERDLNEATSPQVLARLEFARNGAWTSLNVRELRREQLSSGLVQQTLPEIEWRGRSKRLGPSPFYLTFESSLASIQQRGTTLDADYLRGDVAPALTLPWSPVPWLDITPRVSYRFTYWTQSQPFVDGSRQVVDEALSRGLWGYGVDLVGPKFFRVFERPATGAKLKHSIESRISYGFAESFDQDPEILPFDDVDRTTGSGEQVRYALVQRLFAKRPRAAPAEEPDASVILADESEGEPVAGEEQPDSAAQADAPAAETEPVEIASLELSQSRSFDENISSADLDGDGIRESFSPASPVALTGRFNPSAATSLDLRGTFDILFKNVRDVTLSGTVDRGFSQVRFSLVHQNGLGVEPSTLARRSDNTQARLAAGLSLIRNKLQMRFTGSYNPDAPGGQTHFPDQQWQVEYHTQCCTFYVERITRDFSGIDNRRELHFRIDLRGVGKILTSSF